MMLSALVINGPPLAWLPRLACRNGSTLIEHIHEGKASLRQMAPAHPEGAKACLKPTRKLAFALPFRYKETTDSEQRSYPI
ncbi:hypothetical protein [Rhizobium sp. RU35A]|uniref:hypothetical protein n=1 Tax=Rhizobium sp. RU35A TaxID=1907414 RepID=UPI00122D29A4|nr:hypothetical protein [Rhizobium sp. RU35A]